MQSLTHFLAQIPAVSALNIQVLSAGEMVELLLPFDGNSNHHHTVFGGSLSLGATLAGWAVVHSHAPQAQGNIVIKSSQIKYLAPATGDVKIRATLGEQDCAKVQASLERFGRAKVVVACQLYCQDVKVATFDGEYVVFQA